MTTEMIFKSCIIDGELFVELLDWAAPGVRKGAYLISPSGRVYSTLANRFLRPTINEDGYYVLNLRLENGGAKTFYLHRMIMTEFQYRPGCEELKVNYINGQKSESRLDNMEWDTLQGNNLHAKEMGLLCEGEDCPWAILTEAQVREICTIIQNKEYTTLSDIAKAYNVSVTTIGDIARGVTWKEVSGEYDLDYDIRDRFTEDQIHFMCRVFRDNKDKSFQYLYYMIIFYLGLPEDVRIRRRIYKIYKKDPNNFYYITSQYDY
jgi:hypothetical protein